MIKLLAGRTRSATRFHVEVPPLCLTLHAGQASPRCRHSSANCSPSPRVRPLLKMFRSMSWNSTVGGRGNAGKSSFIWRSMALMTTAESFTGPELRVESASFDADNTPLAHVVLFALLGADSALTTCTEDGATSRSCIPLAGISEVDPDMIPEALLVSVSCFAPLLLFVGRRFRSRTTAVVCAVRVASLADPSGMDGGSNASTSMTSMRTETRSQSSEANK